MKRKVQIIICLSLIIAADGWGAIHQWGREFAPFGRLPGHQQNPDVAIGPHGGFAVWQNSSSTSNGERIVFHKLNELLEGQGSPSRLTPDSARTSETHPRVALMPGGGAVVAWESGGRKDRDVRVRFLNAAGQPVTAVQVTNGFRRRNQTKPDVAVNDTGDVLVVWESDRQDGDGKGVFAQRYTPEGVRVGGEIPVNQGIKWNQSQPACAALADGRFIIAWVGEAANGTTLAGTPYMRGHVMGRIFNRRGNALGNEFRLDGGQSLCARPRLLAREDGGYLVGWSQLDETAMVNLWDVHYRVFNRDGLPLGAALRNNKYLKNVQNNISWADLGGEVLMTWDCGTPDDASVEVHGRLISGGAEFRVNTKVVFQQRMAAAAGDGKGHALVLWVDVVSPSNTTLRAQKYTSEGAGANLAAGPDVTEGPIGPMRFPLVMKVEERATLPGRELKEQRESLEQESIVKHENAVQEASQVARFAAAKSAARTLINTAQRTSMRGRGTGSIAKPSVNTAAVAETRQSTVGRVRVTPRLRMRPAARPAAVNIHRMQSLEPTRVSSQLTAARKPGVSRTSMGSANIHRMQGLEPARVSNQLTAASKPGVSRTSMAAQSTLRRYARNYSATRQSAANRSRMLAAAPSRNPASAIGRAQYVRANRVVPSRVARSTASNTAAQRAMQQYARRRMTATTSQSRFMMRPITSPVMRGMGIRRTQTTRPVSPGVTAAFKRAEVMRRNAMERGNQASLLRSVPVPATLDRSGGRISMRINTQAGRRYVVQTSADKSNWRNSGQVHRGTGRSMTLPVNALGGEKFIRVMPTD